MYIILFAQYQPLYICGQSVIECGIKATLVEGKEVICKKKVSTTLKIIIPVIFQTQSDLAAAMDKLQI